VPLLGAFEEQYSEHGPRMQRKRAFTAPERRCQFYVLQARSRLQPARESLMNLQAPCEVFG